MLVPRRDTRVVWCDDGDGLAHERENLSPVGTLSANAPDAGPAARPGPDHRRRHRSRARPESARRWPPPPRAGGWSTAVRRRRRRHRPRPGHAPHDPDFPPLLARRRRHRLRDPSVHFLRLGFHRFRQFGSQFWEVPGHAHAVAAGYAELVEYGALSPLERIWSAAVSIDVCDDPDLVEEMARAGCTATSRRCCSGCCTARTVASWSAEASSLPINSFDQPSIWPRTRIACHSGACAARSRSMRRRSRFRSMAGRPRSTTSRRASPGFRR